MKFGLFIFFALSLAILLPSQLSIYAPLVLGIPHVVSGIQNFYFRDDLPEALRYLLIFFIGTFIILTIFGFTSMLSYVGLLGIIIVMMLMQDQKRRTAIVSLIVAALLIVNVSWPKELNLALVVGHNVVALIIWGLYFADSKEDVLRVFTLCGIGLATILLLEDAWIRAFIFLQLIHYLVWLKWVPEINKTARKWNYFSIMGGIVFGVIGYFSSDPLNLKNSYLALFQFHVYLELMILTHSFVHQKSLALQKFKV